MSTQSTDRTLGVSDSTDAPAASTESFNNLGIAPQILKTLDYYGYKIPTPIQRDAIPVVATGVDVIGIAQTGTGKTLAFGVPTVQRLMLQGGKALIVVPTRELAIQVEESLVKITRPLHLQTAVLIGGEHIGRQIRRLQMGIDIVVATPGRLNDHLKQGTIKLDTVRVVILDEADRMLDMGFAPQIAEIMNFVPKDRQTLLFSATMPDEILHMTKKYQKDPIRIEVARAGTANVQIEQELIIVSRAEKQNMLETLLNTFKGSVLIFSRTRHGASNLTRALRAGGHQAMEIHSDRSLGQRRQALDSFKSGRARILVATDIAARGIDVTGIELVLNYDLPDNADDYIHRIGRTGRAGATGHAISLASPDQAKEVRAIERLMRITLPRSEHSVGELAGGYSSNERRGRQQFHRSERQNNFNSGESRPFNRGGQPQRSERTPRPGGSFNTPRPAGSGSFNTPRPARSSDGQSADVATGISAPKGFVAPRSNRNNRPFRRK